MDDLILLDPSKDRLLDWKGKIETFLAEKLELTIKPDHGLKSVYQGSDFLGYIVKPNYTLVRRRVVGNLKLRLEKFKTLLLTEGSKGLKRYYRYDFQYLDSVRQVLASYLGQI